MDDPKQKTFARKLVVPAVLAVTVLASGCGGPVSPGNDAAPTDAAVADAPHDAGCVPPYFQIDGNCQLVV